jgi:predicted MFS family arabinose efflux permease
VTAGPRAPILREIRAGFSAVYGHRLLRPLAQAIATHFLFAGVVWSVFILSANRDLGIRPLGIGAMAAAGGVGLLLGSVAAPRLAVRLGLRATLVLGSLLVALGVLLYPLAGGPEWLAIGCSRWATSPFPSGSRCTGSIS